MDAMARTLLATLCLLALAEWPNGPAAAAPNANTATYVEATTAIETGNATYAAALEGHDAKAFAGLFAPDAVTMSPHSPVIRGRASIEASMAEAFKTISFSKCELRTSETHITGDVAYELGTYRFEIEQGDQTSDLHGRYLAVWRRVDGTWKIAADASQPDAPEP
jgi:uncharacterized protein (TIGR02246 family)